MLPMRVEIKSDYSNETGEIKMQICLKVKGREKMTDDELYAYTNQRKKKRINS
jgi:hypothetical protein